MLTVIRQLDILVYPPAINILLLVLALFLWKKRHLAIALILVSLATLFIFSLPVISHLMLKNLEDYPAIPPDQLASKNAQAIVLLGGGAHPYLIEYDGARLGQGSYSRLRYSAYIHKHTGLPILATGSSGFKDKPSVATLMQQALASTYRIEPVWVESESRTTHENAIFSAKILKEKNISRIFLVTNSWHMSRSVKLFIEQGLEVIPAPTGMAHSRPYYWRDFIPHAGALNNTRAALHEYLGRLLYFL